MISHHNGIERVPARDELARIERQTEQERRPAKAVYAEPTSRELAERYRLECNRIRDSMVELYQAYHEEKSRFQGELEQLTKELREAEAAWREVCGRLVERK